MRVLFVARPDLETKPGGDTVQVHRTREEFARLNVEVMLAPPGSAPRIPPGIDIVHCFNLRMAHQFDAWVAEAARRGVPALLSPVFWHSTDYEMRSGVVARWKRGLFRAAAAFPSTRSLFGVERRFKSLSGNPYHKRYLERMANRFALLLPNAAVEAEHLREVLDIHVPMRIVYNAARIASRPAPSPGPLPERFILCVGRIEFRKNQHNLIRAMQGLDADLVLVGDINPTERRYWSLCRREARAIGVNILRIPNSSFDVVGGLFRSALLHAQPSWVETPGLASLEAAAAGCPILCTEVGSAPEYFGAHALYCSPSDVGSIRNSIRRLLDAAPDPEATAEFVRARYTWEKTAEACLQAYKEVLLRA